MYLSLSVQDQFINLIRKDFDTFLKQLNYPIRFDYKRFNVWSDTEKYQWKEDASVWMQKRDKAPTYFSVTLDGIDICTFDTTMSKDQTLKQFYNGFLKAYQLPDDHPNKVFIDKECYLDVLIAKSQKDESKREENLEKIKQSDVADDLEAEGKQIAIKIAEMDVAETRAKTQKLKAEREDSSSILTT